ncbi:GNAT family N-acetyltransferase, partial [Salmonella enterica subsp. enterica]|nr:GNAT family N-acetyltransferase [Salmonella enterica subsp. enterica serovar Agona]
DENIQLAPASSRFATELFSVVDRNRKEFSQYMAWPRFVKTVDDESGFLDACLAAHQKNEGKTYVILFNDAAVGLLSFNSIDSANKTAYIGYWLDMRVQGQGVITRALNALVKEYS